MDIAGQVAVVTGAGSGIGEAVSKELGRRAIKGIAVADRNEAVKEVAAAINEGRREPVALAFVGDVCDEAFRRRVYETVSGEFGVPRICVPAAGITRDALSVKVDKTTGRTAIYPVENFRLVTEVDLIAPIYWSLEMVAGIAQERHSKGLGRWEPAEHIQGNIILIGSVSSLGNKGQIAYAAAKAGLEGAAATLMTEAIYHGVRCGVLHPGYTDTPMVRSLGEEYVRDRILPQTQLRRLIRPEEIADAICFMISNSAVSGALWADAGWRPVA
jgi:NAD(P)-dependent dehydrogenase (short-subunit alcohol dehydrogenase family)